MVHAENSLLVRCGESRLGGSIDCEDPIAKGEESPYS